MLLIIEPAGLEIDIGNAFHYLVPGREMNDEMLLLLSQLDLKLILAMLLITEKY